MKIIRILQITKDEFYDHLEQMLLDLAHKSGKEHSSLEDISKGFCIPIGPQQEYTKAALTITDYVRGEFYQAETTSISETIQMEYRTKETPEGLEVTFEQRMLQYEQKRMNKLFRGFSDSIYLSRMSNALYDIQNDILKSRDGALHKNPSIPLQDYQAKRNEKIMKFLTKKEQV